MPKTVVSRTPFERAEPILRVENMSVSVRYYVETLGFTNADWGSDGFTADPDGHVLRFGSDPKSDLPFADWSG